MARWPVWIVCLSLLLLAAGCGGDDKSGNGNGNGNGGEPERTPREALEHQLELLRGTDLEAMRACFVPELRDRITEEFVSEAHPQLQEMSLDALVANIVETERDGERWAEVKMRGERTLTWLVLREGRWLATTLWFR